MESRVTLQEAVFFVVINEMTRILEELEVACKRVGFLGGSCDYSIINMDWFFLGLGYHSLIIHWGLTH